MSPLNVVIRANGGEAIGLGHIRRCLTLAEALARQGATVHFLTNDNQAALDTVRTAGFDAIPVDLEKDFEETRDAIRSLQANVLVVDSYDIDTNYLTRIRDSHNILVAIDDNADRRLPVDVVINGNAYGPSLKYDVLPETMLLLGPQYAILRKEFSDTVVRRMGGPAKKILITIGGSDPARLTPELVDLVLRERPEMQLDVVVGPFFKQRDPFFEANTNRLEQIRVHYNPGDMRSLMLESDLAITGGGQTTYELAATGTPAIAIATADNQWHNLDELVRVGTLRFAGNVSDPSLPAKLEKEVGELVDHPEKRSEMSHRGLELIDGNGTERVASQLIKVLRRRETGLAESGLQLRPAGSGDVRLLWEWANDPTVRQYSHHPETIAWESHVRWYGVQLVSADTRFWILEKSGEPVGQIRYDKNCADNSAEINFLVDRNHRGHGYGTELIRRTRELACSELGVSRITAVTFVENTASARIFESLQFEQLGSALIHGRQCYQFSWDVKGSDNQR